MSVEDGLSPLARQILRLFPTRESGEGLSVRMVYAVKKRPIHDAWELLKYKGMIERIGISSRFRLTEQAEKYLEASKPEFMSLEWHLLPVWKLVKRLRALPIGWTVRAAPNGYALALHDDLGRYCGLLEIRAEDREPDLFDEETVAMFAGESS